MEMQSPSPTVYRNRARFEAENALICVSRAFIGSPFDVKECARKARERAVLSAHWGFLALGSKWSR